MKNRNQLILKYQEIRTKINLKRPLIYKKVTLKKLIKIQRLLKKK